MASRRRGPDGLTDFERDICHAIDRGLSDREAYRDVRPGSRASDNTAEVYVWRVRQRPHCRAYLQELKTKSLARHMDRKDRIVEELAILAFADLADVLVDGPDGPTLRPLATLGPAQRRALSRITIRRTAKGATARVGLHNKLAALDKLCRLFGIFAEGKDADRPDLAEIGAAMSDVERAQRLVAMLKSLEAAKEGADEEAAEISG